MVKACKAPSFERVSLIKYEIIFPEWIVNNIIKILHHEIQSETGIHAPTICYLNKLAFGKTAEEKFVDD